MQSVPLDEEDPDQKLLRPPKAAEKRHDTCLRLSTVALLVVAIAQLVALFPLLLVTYRHSDELGNAMSKASMMMDVVAERRRNFERVADGLLDIGFSFTTANATAIEGALATFNNAASLLGDPFYSDLFAKMARLMGEPTDHVVAAADSVGETARFISRVLTALKNA